MADEIHLLTTGIKRLGRDFPGGPLAGSPGSTPGQGGKDPACHDEDRRPHMPQPRPGAAK